MHLRSLEITGFKSFAKKTEFEFTSPITSIVGPNGSGKSNFAESFRFVLGEQSFKSMRGKRGEDLIFSGTQAIPGQGRASVTLVFDNTKRFLAIDFDEVTLERVVYKDGTNEYRLNGSVVRLKDIIELLAGANIGPSGHHIISQGEADRILSAPPKDRRLMIEDALGLKVFQYKKTESERKLKKTNENKAHILSLQKEIEPHLRFLERQVKKLEKAKEVRESLAKDVREYLKREALYLARERMILARDLEGPTNELALCEKDIERARHTLETNGHHDEKSDMLLSLESEIAQVRKEKDEQYRMIGRLEGEIVSLENSIERAKERMGSDTVVAFSRVETLAENITTLFEGAEAKEASLLREVIARAKEIIATFITEHRGAEDHHKEDEEERLRLVERHQTLKDALQTLAAREERVYQSYKQLEKDIENERNEGREAEKEVFRLMARQTELRATIDKIKTKELVHKRDTEEYEREVREAVVLIGHAVRGFEETELLREDGTPITDDEIVAEARDVQYERRRHLEKLKIRLEELGGANADEIMKEYEEVHGRAEFLLKEIADLEATIHSLEGLIKDLESKLDEKFKEGITTISKEFNTLFTLMFGGGSAGLTVVKEKKRSRIDTDVVLEDADDKGPMPTAEGLDESEEGVEVSVALPNKRIKGLQMLSGGERALTSIALIFAMSRVNPPPFIILDETDAALDEANSRRYGDMIETLAKDSQLILITHNRETMSRAGVLYGVTMGADGASRLLSVKFEEGLKYAK